MYSVDKGNFKQFLLDFSRQISESQKIFKENGLKIKKGSVKNILYLGMGGSAIAGDIISDVLFNELTIPMQVIRGYQIPATCLKSTLIVASSYSGDTEETIHALGEAQKKGAQIIAITSGGKLIDLAKKNQWPYLLIPKGFPPREAFGYLFFLSYQVVCESIGKKLTENEFYELIHLAESIILTNNEETAKGKVFAKDLALRIKNKIPVIYASAPYLSSTATRWKNQFQENSKSMAFSNIIPEMNHNEIVGWEMKNRLLEDFLVIFLENKNENPRIDTRINLTKNIVRDRNIDIVEVYAEGTTLLQQVISLIIISDWVSYYLALLYEIDPASVVNIDYLKGELKKQVSGLDSK
jgi:glucose/mannose-6-phosphate isomerase